MNVSYDPTRELYENYNNLFVKHWAETKQEKITVKQSHGGSGAQAQKVITGQEADVVALALSYDIDIITMQTDLLPKDWQTRLPNNSCPYTSTIVFLVRKGNPKGINDWPDLLKDGVEIITPNPKTSGGARWNYLAAWGYILKKELGDLKVLQDPAKAEEVKAAHAKAREFVKEMFSHTTTLDTGARGSSQRFANNKQGDVLLAWENEAFYFQKMEPAEGFEIVVPSITILTEPPVAVVDKIVEKRGSRDIAEEYLKFLYEPAAQDVIAKNFYRPSHPDVVAKYANVFPKVDAFTITEVFGSWDSVQKEHFNADAVFDQITMENAK
jgi:sulfate transport system substrate-binding protein